MKRKIRVHIMSMESQGDPSMLRIFVRLRGGIFKVPKRYYLMEILKAHWDGGKVISRADANDLNDTLSTALKIASIAAEDAGLPTLEDKLKYLDAQFGGSSARYIRAHCKPKARAPISVSEPEAVENRQRTGFAFCPHCGGKLPW